MKYVKCLLAMALAAVALGALVGTASANRLSFSSSTLRGTWASTEFAGGFGTVRCSMTIEGSLHSRSIVKTAGALIGYITRASIGPCATGSATVLTATLPWHIRYSSFSGTLPNISRITANVIGMGLQIREPTLGITCLATSTAAEPVIIIIVREAGGIIVIIVWGGEIETSCGLKGTLGGSSNAPTVLGATTRITVTLI